MSEINNKDAAPEPQPETGATSRRALLKHSSLALVGIRPGQTRLHVVAEGHASEYVVTVLPAK